MNTDHSIRSTENSSNSPSYRFRMAATDTSNQFIELFTSLAPATPQQPASLLYSDVNSQLDERAHAKQQADSKKPEKSEAESSEASKPESDNDTTNSSSDPIICCFWNDAAQPPVVVEPKDQIKQQPVEQEAPLEQATAEQIQPIENTTRQLTEVETPETNQTAALPGSELEYEAEQPILQAAEPVGEATATAEVIETQTNNAADAENADNSQIDPTEDLQVVGETLEEATADAELQEKIQSWAEERKQRETHDKNHAQQPKQELNTDSKPVAESGPELTEKVTEIAPKISDDKNVETEEPTAEDSSADDTAESVDDNDDPKGARRIRRDGSRTYKSSAQQDSDNPNAGKKQDQIPSLKQRLAAAAAGEAVTATEELSETNSELTNKSTPGSNFATAIENNRILKAAGTKFESQLASAISEVSGKPSSNSNTPTVATTSGEQKIQAASSGSVKQTAKTTLQRLPPQTINRITSALKEAPDGNSTMRLRLNPVELGNIDIEIAFKAGVMSAKLKAENGQTQQMLQEGIESLKTRLAEHGISVESLDVELGTDSQSSGGNNPSGQELDSGQDRRQSGFFEQQKQQRQQTVDKRTSPTEESPNKEVDAVGPWAVNVVA